METNNIYAVWLKYPGSASATLVKVFSNKKVANEFIKLSGMIKKSLFVQELELLDSFSQEEDTVES